MNCDNCGAPLEAVAGRSHFICGYCQTLHFPAPLEGSADRITPLDEDADIVCPVCDRQLKSGALDNAHVLYCCDCYGILVANETFAHVIGTRRADYGGSEQVPVPIDAREFERSLDCPRCAQRMETHPYHGPGCVVIDSCTRCQLVWLDHGEVAAIERAPGQRRPVATQQELRTQPAAPASSPEEIEVGNNFLDWLLS